jgi:hypothetical protein
VPVRTQGERRTVLEISEARLAVGIGLAAVAARIIVLLQIGIALDRVEDAVSRSISSPASRRRRARAWGFSWAPAAAAGRRLRPTGFLAGLVRKVIGSASTAADTLPPSAVARASLAPGLAGSAYLSFTTSSKAWLSCSRSMARPLSDRWEEFDRARYGVEHGFVRLVAKVALVFAESDRRESCRCCSSAPRLLFESPGTILARRGLSSLPE